MFHLGEASALTALRKAATLWREESRFLNAGLAMSQAVYAAWGNGEEVDRCYREAINDYQSCIGAERIDSVEALAALTKLISELYQWARGSTGLTTFLRALQGELAQRVLGIATNSMNRCLFLVNGVSVSSDLESGWAV